MKKGLSFFLTITLLCGCLSLDLFLSKESQLKVNAGENEEWVLAWSDEFDGTSLNRSNWNVEVNGYGGWNNELQYYCDSSENIQVNDGTLKLIAQKKSYQGKEYTSARLNTQNKVTVNHGRIEARIKLPSFMGAFPAFWMMGANGQTWPACGEIDIMEAINNESIIYGTAHWQASYANNEDKYDSKGSSTYEAGIRVDITQWHTYGIEWTEDKIVWFVDDNYYHSVNITSEKEMEELSIPCYILLNFAIGGDWPGFNIDNTALPATMEVDYVRAYEKNPNYEEPPTTIVVEDSVADYNGSWSYTLGSWGNVAGNVSTAANAKDGFTANLTAIGDDMWAGQASLKNISYIPGNTYTFRSIITSNINKKIFIKVEGDNSSEIAADYINLTAGVPYTYEKSVFIAGSYTGSISIYYFFSGGMDGESLSANTAANINVKDVTFYTETSVIAPGEEETTEEPITEEPTTEEPTETPIKTIDGGIEVNGYQFSTVNNGVRTIYSVDSIIDNKKVIASGLIYSLSDYVTDSDLYVGSSNYYVRAFESTDEGYSQFSYSESDIASTYVMTMKLATGEVSELTTIWKIRAYAKMSDGTYIYSKVYDYSVFEIAEKLYKGHLMSSKERHNYIYINVIKKVDADYIEVDYEWDDTIVGL